MVDDATKKIAAAFGAEAAISAISEALSDRWYDLESGSSDTDASLTLSLRLRLRVTGVTGVV